MVCGWSRIASYMELLLLLISALHSEGISYTCARILIEVDVSTELSGCVPFQWPIGRNFSSLSYRSGSIFLATPKWWDILENL